MKTESATGIILRTRPLTETSLIVHWLTPELGRLATVAKGARRPKSPFGGKLDLFYTADFTFSRSRSSDLHNLREVKLIETHAAIRSDLARLEQAAYATAFIEQATETETPLPEIHALLARFLGWLCQDQPKSQGIFALELKLLRELGMEPDLAATSLTAGTRKIISNLQADDWPMLARLKLSAEQTAEIRHWLHRFLVLHLGRLPRGRTAAVSGGH
jgi:DNA repair protein RecO (recombination protein O)